jgi:hypothetical protein
MVEQKDLEEIGELSVKLAKKALTALNARLDYDTSAIPTRDLLAILKLVELTAE